MLTLLTALIASLVHVVTGPDHLAAITPLAIDSREKSWVIGLLWGTGHTVGMLLIGLLFLLFKEFLPIDLISAYSDRLIGLLLIVIGCWAIFRGSMVNPHLLKPHSHPHNHDGSHHLAHFHQHVHEIPAKKGEHHREVIVHSHPHEHSDKTKNNYFAAFSVGSIHGFAGFSHLFILLPSLALPTMLDSIVYIVAFAFGTILTMILFSFAMGQIAYQSSLKNKQNFLKWFTLTGGFIASTVGILWIFHPF